MTQDDLFLAETRYCDYSHPELRQLAARFRDRHDTTGEQAVAVFSYVRDSIKYEIGNWQRTASRTLAQASGTCTNSANLMVALLRSLGIPAGYGVMSVAGREYFGPLAPARLSRFASEISTHVYAWVRLDGEWLRCDPSDDMALSVGTQHLNPQSRPIAWDGRQDAMLHLNPEHILRDKGPIADADGLIGKPMRMAIRIPVRIANYYMDFMREEGLWLVTIAEAEEQFMQWLRSRHPAYYRFYRALPVGVPDGKPTV